MVVTSETSMQIPLQVPTFEWVHVILFSASPGPGGWGIVQLEASWVPAAPRGGHGGSPRLREASEAPGDCREFHGVWGGCCAFMEYSTI